MKIKLSKWVGCSENSTQRKILALSTYIRKKKDLKPINLNFHLRKVGEKKSKISRRK